jgi:hypothetical protein
VRPRPDLQFPCLSLKGVSTRRGSRAFYQIKPYHPCSGKEPVGFASVGSGDRQKEAAMFSPTDRTISASRGTLAGDILWLATITFVFAIVIGMVG